MLRFLKITLFMVSLMLMLGISACVDLDRDPKVDSEKPPYNYPDRATHEYLKRMMKRIEQREKAR